MEAIFLSRNVCFFLFENDVINFACKIRAFFSKVLNFVIFLSIHKKIRNWDAWNKYK